MLCCYHPTTTVAIDDDVNFLNVLTEHSGVADCIGYQCPHKAIDALQNKNPFESILSRVLINDHDMVCKTNIHQLHEEIYSEKRFNAVSVIIVDYYMDAMNGIDVCEKLAHHPAKKILLTGGNDKEKIAVEAFNKGIIHQFVNKADPKFPILLKQKIKQLQIAYFKDLTTQLLPSNHMINSVIENPNYQKIFQHIQSSIKEYYLLDNFGSYLFLAENGKPTWLVIKHKSDIDDFVNLTLHQDGEHAWIKILSHYKKIPFFFTEEDFQQPVEVWHEYLHPANPIKGLNDYYYAVIDGHVKNNINHKNLISQNSRRK